MVSFVDVLKVSTVVLTICCERRPLFANLDSSKKLGTNLQCPRKYIQAGEGKLFWHSTMGSYAFNDLQRELVASRF